MIFAVLNGVWDLEAGVKQFIATKIACQEDCSWERELFLLSKSITRLWLSVLLLKAKLSSLFYKAFVFLHNSNTFEQYLSNN